VPASVILFSGVPTQHVKISVSTSSLMKGSAVAKSTCRGTRQSFFRHALL
jgi:hypothetical protein